MAEAYTVAAELQLKTNIPQVMREVLDVLGRGRTAVADMQAELDALGKSGKGISGMVRQLGKLSEIKLPVGLTAGLDAVTTGLSGAVGKMDELLTRAKETAAAFAEIKPPRFPVGPGRVPGGGAGGGGGHGGDPIIEGMAGGEVLEWMAHAYEMNAQVETTYRAMQSDKRLAGDSPAMAQIRTQAAGVMSKYRVLNPLDVAKLSGEAFTLAGGDMTEQSGILDILANLEQTQILRNPKIDPADAQRQAVAIVRGLDIANRFYDPKTGEFSIERGQVEAQRALALTSASNGLVTGQQFLSFEKSAGIAGQGLSLEGEARLAHIIDVNPRLGATAIKSLENLFSSGGAHMFKRNLGFWEKHGIFKHGKTVDAALLRSDPLLWVEKHLSGFTADQIDSNSQRMNVGSLVNEVKGSAANINRQAVSVAQQDNPGNTTNLANSPGGKILAFDASLERFQAALGKFEAGPGSKILDGLTSGLDKLTTVMSAHPTASKDFLELTAGLAAFAAVRGAVSLSGIGGAISGLGGALKLFARGAPAIEGIELLAGGGAAAGGGLLLGLAGGFVALGAALVGLPPLLKLVMNAFGPTHATTNMNDRGHAGPTTPFTAPEHSYSRGNYHGPPIQHSAYSGGAVVQPINLYTTVQMDGKTVGRHVQRHIVRDLGDGVHHGTSSWDPISTSLPAGVVPA